MYWQNVCAKTCTRLNVCAKTWTRQNVCAKTCTRQNVKEDAGLVVQKSILEKTETKKQTCTLINGL